MNQKIASAYFLTILMIQPHIVFAKGADSVKFEQLSDGPEKLAEATSILKVVAENSIQNQMKSTSVAKEAMEYLQSKTREFENSLSKVVVNKIIRDIPNSRADISGFTYIFPTCEQSEYQSLKKQISLNILGPHGVEMALLAGLYEDRRRPRYFKRLAEYAKSKSCLDKRCKSLVEVYKLFERLAELTRPDIDKNISMLETELKAMWKTPAIAAQQTDTYGRQWPNCMGALNLQLGEFIRFDVTIARGKYIVSEYQRLGVKNDRDLEKADIRILPEDFLKSGNIDGWGTYFAAKVSGGQVGVVSAGPDMIFETKDDVLIPSN
jgi:hypothetical protein